MPDLLLEGRQHRAKLALAPGGAPPARPRALDLDHQFLEVRGRDPQAALGIHRGLDHGLVVALAADQGQRHRALLPDEIHQSRAPASGETAVSRVQGWDVYGWQIPLVHSAPAQAS